MTYVVTFENNDGYHHCVTVTASCVEIAVMEAKERINIGSPYYYCDSDILSVIRV